MDARTRLLLEGPVGSTILRLSLPNVIVMVVQTSIGLIETYFVAKLGLDALAGMALVFPLYMLLQMVAAGAMGGGILSAVARALGSGRRDRANELVWDAVAITIGIGALTTAAMLLFAPRLYALMGDRDGSLAAATTYSAVVFAGTIPLWLFNSFAAIIRGTGNMFFRRPSSRVVRSSLFHCRPRSSSAWDHSRNSALPAAPQRSYSTMLSAARSSRPTSGPVGVCSKRP
jgi:Na+-driven multidrug efflux pump